MDEFVILFVVGTERFRLVVEEMSNHCEKGGSCCEEETDATAGTGGVDAHDLVGSRRGTVLAARR